MKLKYADWNVVNKLATKQVGQFSVYIANGLSYDGEEDDAIWAFVREEIKKLYGDGTLEYLNVIGNVIHGGLFFFGTDAKAREFYSIFEQELTDSSAIYAALYCPVHGCLTENT